MRRGNSARFAILLRHASKGRCPLAPRGALCPSIPCFYIILRRRLRANPQPSAHLSVCKMIWYCRAQRWRRARTDGGSSAEQRQHQYDRQQNADPHDHHRRYAHVTHIGGHAYRAVLFHFGEHYHPEDQSYDRHKEVNTIAAIDMERNRSFSASALAFVFTPQFGQR